MCEWMRRISLIITILFFSFMWLSVGDYVGAKSGLRFRDISEAGWLLWLFIIVGGIVILLQLIPAVIVATGLFTNIYKSVGSKHPVVEPKGMWDYIAPYLYPHLNPKQRAQEKAEFEKETTEKRKEEVGESV